MSEQEFLNIIIECINRNDFSTLKSSTPFESRLNLFHNGKIYNKNRDNVYAYFGERGLFENLFTEEEAKELLNSYLDIEGRYILILNLSDLEKTKYINEIIENIGYVICKGKYEEEINLKKYFYSFKDKEIMSKVIYENYKSFPEISYFDMIDYITKSIGEYKMKLFNEVAKEQINYGKEVLNNYNITTIKKFS